MRRRIILGLGVSCLVLGAIYYFPSVKSITIISPLWENWQAEKPLLNYTFFHLKYTKFPVSQITLGETQNEDTNTRSQLFYFSVPKFPGSTEMEKVSGMLTSPVKPGSYPVIIMFRGFIPKAQFISGSGTQPVATEFAKTGFITLAPDFLGFGESARGAVDPFEDRFQTYTSALSLLTSLPSLNTGLAASYSGSLKADVTKIGMWGHSNGGHIALATLAISGVNFPTVLWAPVSKAFPYSVLNYSDESDDQGKVLRKMVAKFESIYNADEFSPPNYFSWIQAPIEISQGTADQEVPVWWSDDLVKTLKKDKVEVTYNTYPGADHNLLPNAWSDAVQKSIEFYQNQFNKR